jgi:hypothetical protein
MNRAAKIRALGAAAWVSGSNFATDEDTRDIEPYYRGLQIGREADAIYIGIDGSWRANMKDGTAYTDGCAIGVAANTRWVYQGFLDSRVPIFVQRFQGDRIVHYELVASPEGPRTAVDLNKPEDI